MPATDTTYFFNRILPEGGVRFLAEPHTNRSGEETFKHFPFMTNDEMAAFVEKCNDENRTIYHACATYKGVEYRTTESGFTYAVGRRGNNVQALKSVYEDIDVRKTTVPSYDSQRDAVAALDEVRKRIGIPLPMIVSSGVGLHLYWTLANAVTPSEWHEIAKLKSLCLRHAGLRLDPSRTEDAASILRPVGAKRIVDGKKKVVRILRDAPDFDSGELLSLFQQYAGENGLLVPEKRPRSNAPILGPGNFGHIERQKVAAALKITDPNDYETWMNVGMYMAALLPLMGDEGVAAWLAYSDRADDTFKKKNDVSGTNPETMIFSMSPDMSADAALGKLMLVARDQAIAVVEKALRAGDLSGSGFDAWVHLRTYHKQALRGVAARFGLEVV